MESLMVIDPVRLLLTKKTALPPSLAVLFSSKLLVMLRFQPTARPLRTAERLIDALFRRRRFGEVHVLRLVLERPPQHLDQRFEWPEIAARHGCRDGLLHAVVARDESRIGSPHGRSAG